MTLEGAWKEGDEEEVNGWRRVVPRALVGQLVWSANTAQVDLTRYTQSCMYLAL